MPVLNPQKIPIFIPTYIGDQSFAPARVQPRLLYYNGTLGSEQYYLNGFQNTSNPKTLVKPSVDEFPYFDNYYVVTGSFPTTDSKSLLFFNEQSVYGTAPLASLYSEYWEDYVSLLYNPTTRLLNASAVIPLADYVEMELNDIVNFRGNDYHLRAINEYNLSTGECTIQLLGPILKGSFDEPTITEFNVTNDGSAAYVFSGAIEGSNPTLTLKRGNTYTFDINASGHPFWIKTNFSTGTGDAYNDGVTNNGIANGIITFNVKYNAPSTLYYNCQNHSSMKGTINIIS